MCASVGWRARLALHEADDEGRGTDAIAIDQLELGSDELGSDDLRSQRAEVVMDAGAAWIRANEGVSVVAFRGSSVALAAGWMATEIVFELSGALDLEARA